MREEKKIEKFAHNSLDIRLAIGRSAVNSIHCPYPLAAQTDYVALSNELLPVMFANPYSLPVESFLNCLPKNYQDILCGRCFYFFFLLFVNHHRHHTSVAVPHIDQVILHRFIWFEVKYLNVDS